MTKSYTSLVITMTCEGIYKSVRITYLYQYISITLLTHKGHFMSENKAVLKASALRYGVTYPGIYDGTKAALVRCAELMQTCG